MKINKFDVVELNNKNKATILDVQSNGYLVEIVNTNGKTLGNEIIYDKDINKTIYSKNKEYKM